MIEPFFEKSQHKGVISYGLSPFGYDIRAGEEFKIFTNIQTTSIDPKNFDRKAFVDFKGKICVIPPNSFALAKSMEYFRMPADIFALAVGKSTYARCGIVTNVTPLNPGWEGYITLEISNTTPLPAKVYAGEGIVQIIFFRGLKPIQDYVSKGGKYHAQKGIVLPKI